jgi:pimeloyl-ACP methyl ester carboxylesterase
VLPGARDVASPYGSIRVYEWGREEGPKVLLVHGITTPCIALGGVAHALVDRGCRVMLFDLYVHHKTYLVYKINAKKNNLDLAEDTPTVQRIYLKMTVFSQLRSYLP